jgi:hypothetical protein
MLRCQIQIRTRPSCLCLSISCPIQLKCNVLGGAIRTSLSEEAAQEPDWTKETQ